MKFVFDLDGTLTTQETLPAIAHHFGLGNEIADLTRDTMQGHISFETSLIQRVSILGGFSVSQTSEFLSGVGLFPEILAFIEAQPDDCIVATSNLDVWVQGLCDQISCPCLTSLASVTDDRIVNVNSILRKDEIVQDLQKGGETVVYIGDGSNDVEAMRVADCAIASGLVHWPAQAVLESCDFAVCEENALTKLLGYLKSSDNKCQWATGTSYGNELSLGSDLEDAGVLDGPREETFASALVQHVKQVSGNKMIKELDRTAPCKPGLEHAGEVIFALSHPTALIGR